MAPPSWLATQPPTAIISFGLARLRCLTRPRSANTFCSALSRTEQVLKTMTSASSGLAAGVSHSAWASTQDILSESYSFIWQPKVRMKSLPAMELLHRIALRGFLRRKDPDAADLALEVELVLDHDAARDRGGNHDHVAVVANLRTGGEQRALAVDLDRHAFDVAHGGALRIRRNGAQLRLRRKGRRQRRGGGETECDACVAYHRVSLPKRR